MSSNPLNLGDLEWAILEHLWERGPETVKTTHQLVGIPREITLNTVQSAMKRLWEKELLDRKKSGHAYVYRTRMNRRGLTELMVGQLIDRISDEKMEVALQAFVDLADSAGEETLDRLEKLVAARRRADEE